MSEEKGDPRIDYILLGLVTPFLVLLLPLVPIVIACYWLGRLSAKVLRLEKF